MKTIALLIVLVASQAWAGDRDAYWDAYHQCAKDYKDYGEAWDKCKDMIPVAPERTRYEYDIIPEAYLKQRLNEGWEWVPPVYQVLRMRKDLTGFDMGVTETINKAIVRRVKP